MVDRVEQVDTLSYRVRATSVPDLNIHMEITPLSLPSLTFGQLSVLPEAISVLSLSISSSV